MDARFFFVIRLAGLFIWTAKIDQKALKYWIEVVENDSKIRQRLSCQGWLAFPVRISNTGMAAVRGSAAQLSAWLVNGRQCRPILESRTGSLSVMAFGMRSITWGWLRLLARG